MGLRQLFGILLKRATLGAAVAAITFIPVFVAFSQKAPMYAASGSLVIEPKLEQLLSARPQQGVPTLDTIAVDTQVEILRSPALAEAVVRRLKLWNDAEFNRPAPGLANSVADPQTSEDPAPQLVARATDALMSRLWVRRAGPTLVIEVGASSTSPTKAALLVNTVMDVYLHRQLERKLAALVRANQELGLSLDTMRQEAEDAEARVQQYKIAHGLLSAEGATMAEQEVSRLNQQIAAAKAETAEKRARLAAAMGQLRLGAGGADVGAALGSVTIQQLRDREAELSIGLAELQADFNPAYPEVKRTAAQLQDVRAQIQSEIDRVLSSLRAEAVAAAGREASLLASRSSAQGGLAANSKTQVGLLALQQRADAARQVYQAYLNRAKQVAAEGGLQQPGAAISSPARVPTSPFSPNKRLGGALALLASLLTGGLAMLVGELWDKSLRSRLDIERELDVPFAGIVPEFSSVRSRRLRRTSRPAEYLVNNPFSGFAEAFRSLGAFLTINTRGDHARMIAITSAVPREGKSLTSLCLARTLALSGARVVLVDCDLRQRGLSRLIGASGAGLLEVVQDKVPLQEALMHDFRSNCFILPAAYPKAMSHGLFSNPQTEAVLRGLCGVFDYVILDAPPVLGVADARILAANADRVLYLVHWNKTPVRTAQAAIDILQESGAQIAGALLTKVDVKSQALYGYGDASDYYHYFKKYYIAPA